MNKLTTPLGTALGTALGTVLASGLAVGMTLTAAPAMANDADVIRRGSCTGSADWKLKASPEDGRIEVEGEVDSNKVGQTWRWRIVHNGDLSARGVRKTVAPSGSFSVRRLLVDADGTDRIVFRARNVKSGEVCHGVVRF